MIFLRVFLFLIVFTGLSSSYLYYRLLKHHPSVRLRVLYWLPECLLFLWFGILYLQGDSYSGGMGIFMVCSFALLIPKMVFTVFHALTTALRNYLKWQIPTVFISIVPTLLCAVSIIYGAWIGTTRFTLHKVTFASPDLPASFDGYRVLQLSDIHAGSWQNRTEAMHELVKRCNDLHPDLIVFTGDLINELATELDKFTSFFAQLKARDGVYACMGNHDYGTHWHWKQAADSIRNIRDLQAREAAMGWKMLNNTHAFLYRGKDSIALVGVENVGNPPFPNEGDLGKALRQTGNSFKILLSHDPTHWRKEVLSQSDVQLMLAGHTHEMQFRIFGWSPASLFYKEHQGLYVKDGRGLYVNGGIGFVLLPIRLGAWPEITIITLKKSNR